MKIIFFLIFLISCSTPKKNFHVNELNLSNKPLAVINNIPFVEQTPEMCGPTALFMAIKKHNSKITLEEITSITYIPSAHGTYKQDMLAASRRLGFATYKVSSVESIFHHLALGVPVIMFHKNIFLWKEHWHFSVLTGYDLFEENFYAHIGPYQFRPMGISALLEDWKGGGSWAYVVLPPGQVPIEASFEESLENALAFLRLHNFQAANALALEIENKWPDRFEPDVIRAEALFNIGNQELGLKVLIQALEKQPENVLLKQKIQALSKN